MTDPRFDVAAEPPPAAAPNGADTALSWVESDDGRLYVTRPRPKGARGRPRRIYRQGEESPAEALTRDERSNGDKRPRRKPKRPKMPDAPRTVDLKALELTFAEAFKSPSMICASFGDEWASEHFADKGPYLARNLILASQHNPWLRAKLEEAATGQDAMLKVMSLLSVGGALVLYIVPPVIWWFNLPAPAKTREMFGIPDHKPDEQPAFYRAGPPGMGPRPAPAPPPPPEPDQGFPAAV